MKKVNLPDILDESYKPGVKKKILTLSDHPLSPSGVGTQTKYVIEALLETGRYQVVSLGGAIKHNSYEPTRVSPHENDWIIYPVDNYGTHDIVRSIMRTEKPDMLWFMTDPRFYGWLWEIENEIRANIPMVYYHVWDNYPPPMYNRPFYLSNDAIVSISKVTHDIVSKVSPEVENIYLPHAVDSNIFRKIDSSDIKEFAIEHFGDNYDPDRVVFFWNNRNARRKQSGSLIWWFNEFAKEVGPEKVQLVVHTDPKDQHGQDLEVIIHDLKADDGRIILSTQKVPPEVLSMLYNLADCTINISDAEGFGLSTLESLACGTPIISSNSSALPEIVQDFGQLYEPGNSDALKDCIENFYLNRSAFNDLAKKGSLYANETFNWEKIALDYEEQFLETIEKFNSC